MDLLTIKEVAVWLRLNPATIYHLAQKGKIPGAVKIGRQWRFIRSDVEEWINAQSSFDTEQNKPPEE